MIIADGWKEYEIIDASDGEKLERYGNIILRRPDPLVVWKRQLPPIQTDGIYHRSSKGGGHWSFNHPLPEQWIISYKHLRFHVHPTAFKHTGIFPEQAANWDYIYSAFKERPGARLLNLFAYTGGASMAAAAAGGQVCHVDASKGMVAQAKSNFKISGLEQCPTRFIVDDCIKFVKREIKRGNKYDGIVMDPPSYGRGPGGEMWRMADHIYDFIMLCKQLLSDRAMFMIVNSYTTGLSPAVMHSLMTECMGNHAKITCHELCLPIGKTSLVLPCGQVSRAEICKM